MQFEWDSRKAKLNLTKHGVSFEEASTVFYDPLSATFNDPDHSKNEDRYITIGLSCKNNLLVISYTEKEKIIRIISVRSTTPNERKRHEEN